MINTDWRSRKLLPKSRVKVGSFYIVKGIEIIIRGAQIVIFAILLNIKEYVKRCIVFKIPLQIKELFLYLNIITIVCVISKK
jgi:hypothetical protein